MIPPEKLLTKKPDEYDRMMNTNDISGATSKIRYFNPDNHGNSLRNDDIEGFYRKFHESIITQAQGTKPKKYIR